MFIHSKLKFRRGRRQTHRASPRGRPGPAIMTELTEEEVAAIRGQLHEMRVEHRDLDLVIEHLILSPPPDQLLVRRLKKRKLLLKDRMDQLERLLVPDVPA